MKDALANKLLAKVMDWSAEQLAAERPVLQALATYKYDSYRQFSPGMRFIASLAVWLDQFEPAERQAAYDFVRERLVFVSDAEIDHLVEIAFPDHVRPRLLSWAAEDDGLSRYRVAQTIGSETYKQLLRQTLYLGLSDGAKTDIFRRSGAPDIVHEQVYSSYWIPDEKAMDMRRALTSDMSSTEVDSASKRYRAVVLLDDFSASGISYLREEEDGFGGKVSRVLGHLYDPEGTFQKARLVDPDDLRVYLLLYVATTQAREYLQGIVDRWRSGQGESARGVEIIVVQEIPESVRVSEPRDGAFVDILKAYFDAGVVDEHYRKGRHERPHLGFDECALPLVLVHNTPNNSVALLWQEAGGVRSHRGLFPRVSRHKAGAAA
jgi:hypothetical protein